ncbi:YecR-like lipoprotein [compost metagenome]
MRAFSLALLALAASVAVTGCATKKDFYATGGSRADGTVDMAYDFAQFEQPVVDVNQAHNIAKSKCQVWGYQEAEAFGGKQQHCNQFNGYGTCVAGQVVIKYQCIGDLGTASTAGRAASQANATANSLLSKTQWQQQQLEQLGRESLSYEEYQRRYKQIVGE